MAFAHFFNLFSGFKDKVLKLRGACEANQTLDVQDTKKVRFYINKDLETELVVVVSFDSLLASQVLHTITIIGEVGSKDLQPLVL